MNNEEIFGALKKCNQIGKKLSLDGIYLLVSGMMIGHKFQDISEPEASGLGISFIESKILNKLGAIAYIGIKIDGNLLYQMSKEYEFKNFDIDDKYLNINFNATIATDESFNDDFKLAALERGFKDVEIDDGIASNFNNDIDLYEFYLKYKKVYKPSVKTTIKSLKCKIIKDDEKILKKSNSVIDKLSTGKFIAYKTMSSEIIERILEASQPIEIKLESEEKKIYILRIMKSLFLTASSKSECEIRLIGNGDFNYLIIEIINSGFITCIVYKIINFEEED